MLTRHQFHNLTWIDIESPNHDEIAQVGNEYDIHPSVLKELRSPSSRQKVDYRDESIYLVLHFPVMEPQHSTGEVRELDCIIGKNFLITVHYETITPLYNIGKQFEVSTLLDRKESQNAGHIFYHIVNACYEALETQMEFVTADLKSAEKRIFRGGEKQMVNALSQINRRILDFRIALRSHNDIWESFSHASLDLFGTKYAFFNSSIQASYNKLISQLDNNYEILSELRATNDSLLSSRTNETMIHLTMMAFVTFPLSLIAGIFSMTVKDAPIVGRENDFWIIIGLMAFTGLFVFLFFRYRKWL